MSVSRHGRDHQPKPVEDHLASNADRHRSGKAGASVRGLHDPTIFVEDRKGDRQNLVYGSLHRYAVPRYHAAGHGNLIGLDARFRIVSRSDSHRQVDNIDLDSARKTRKHTLLSQVAGDEDTISVPRDPRENGLDLHEEFVRIDDDQTIMRRRLGSAADAPPNTAEDMDTSSASSDSEGEGAGAFDSFKQDPIHQHHLKLCRATEQNPEDLQTWLDLIDYHQVVFGPTRDGGLATTYRGMTELKISIYEQALSKVHSPQGKHVLILGLMQEGIKVWDAQKQASRLKGFLDTDSSFEIWILYLNFVQTNAVKFTLEECLTTYQRCFDLFARAGPPRLRDSRRIYILLRLTLFLWQSGFTERAIGVWQALLEFNLFRPLSAPSTSALQLFEEFWASEVARVGEEGAVGWSSSTSTEVPAHADRIVSPTDGSDFANWAAAEIESENEHQMPARALDDVNEADPYRTLLFADVEEFLFSLASNEGRALLLDAYFLFAGLAPASSLSESHDWKRDPFIFSHPSTVLKFPLLEGNVVDDQDLRTLLRDVSILSAVTGDSPSFSWPQTRRIVHICPATVRRTLTLLAHATEPDVAILEYAIAMEAEVDLLVARKTAKAFLKRNPQVLSLYALYARIEDRLGNDAAAERVRSTAITLRDTLSRTEEGQLFLLWRDWAYSLMHQHRAQDARKLLAQMAGGRHDLDQAQNSFANDQISAAAQIKTKAILQARIEASLSQSNVQGTVATMELLALHAYLHGGLHVEPAMGVYHNLLGDVDAAPPLERTFAEALHESRAQFLHAHATAMGKDYQPRQISNVLMESTRAFPENLYLLRLYYLYTQKSGLVDRLRQVNTNRQRFDRKQHQQAQSSVVPAVFDLLIELSRPAYSGSTSHSIRASFQRAVGLQSTGCGHQCVAIWHTFIFWECAVATGQLGPGANVTAAIAGARKGHDNPSLAASEALFAALTACPWAKEIYMLAFTQPVLRHALSTERLNALYQSMLDRGLRVRLAR